MADTQHPEYPLLQKGNNLKYTFFLEQERMEDSIPICGLILVLHLATTQAIPAVFTLWVPVWKFICAWALVLLPQGETFGYFSQRKQIFIVRIVKFHLQSTGVNFHTFATVRGNAQCLHGNMIISNSKNPLISRRSWAGIRTIYCYHKVLLWCF